MEADRAGRRSCAGAHHSGHPASLSAPIAYSSQPTGRAPSGLSPYLGLVIVELQLGSAHFAEAAVPTLDLWDTSASRNWPHATCHRIAGLPTGSAPMVQDQAEPFPILGQAHAPYTGTHLHLQVVIMALIVGSLFSGQSHDPADARNFFGVAFLAIMFLSMGAMPELGITFDTKP